MSRRWAEIAVLLMIGLGGCTKSPEAVDANANALAGPEAVPPPGVTLSNYDRLGTGAAMYDDVVEAFGSAGKVQSSAEMGGKKTATYNWPSADQSGQVTAIFENDRLISKSQFGLK